MNFHNHSELEGQHAFLSASKYHWINYSSEKVAQAYINFLASQRGTQLHAFACECIRLGQRLPEENKTLNMYVNDAIGYMMTPEQPLFFSSNCFGTADAIGFDDHEHMLRIHDLKTGEGPTSMHQLEVYMALFCLEYKKKPDKIDSELRIYQQKRVLIHHPNPLDILRIMDKIVTFDKEIDKVKLGG